MDQPTLNRELIAADLQALAEKGGAVVEAMVPAMAENLAEIIRTSPLPLGPLRGRVASLAAKVVTSRLQGSVAPALSASFFRLLELSDADLSALLNGVGAELGAWAGYRPALTVDQAAALMQPAAALLGLPEPSRADPLVDGQAADAEA